MAINCCAGDIIYYFKSQSQSGSFEKAVIDIAGSGPFHVGLCVSDHNVVHVLLEEGVLCEEIVGSMKRAQSEWIQIYTLKETPDREQIIRNAVDFGMSIIGNNYNDIFSHECKDSKGSPAYYCSQVITEAFPSLQFPEHSLKFGDEKKEISDFWMKYFEEKGHRVPLGEKGSHPEQLLRGAMFVKKCEYHK